MPYQDGGMPQDVAKVRMEECSRKSAHGAERRYLYYTRTTEYRGCGRDASAEERNMKATDERSAASVFRKKFLGLLVWLVGFVLFCEAGVLNKRNKIKAVVDVKRMKSSRIYDLTRSKIKMYQMLCVCAGRGGGSDSYKFALHTERTETSRLRV